MDTQPRLVVRQLLVCIACIISACYPGASPAQEHPSILLILTDDVGWGDLKSYNANSQVSLPTLEQLAADGMQFTDAHTPAAKCAPVRYSIVSGNYHWRGMKSFGQWEFMGGSQILANQQTIGHVLQQAGYATAFIGKHHMGGQFYLKNSNSFATASMPETDVDFSRQFRDGPIDSGFDYSFIALRGVQDTPYAYFENDRLFGNPDDLMHWAVGDYGDTKIAKEGIGLPDWNTRQVGPTFLEQAVQFIDSHHRANLEDGADQPFFIHYNTGAVHSPWKPPIALRGTPILGATGIKDRTDLILEIDETLNIIQQELAMRGLLENTLIIFTSDNGGGLFPAELTRGHDAVGGLRGSKGMIFEGGHRVPLILKWGDGSASGSSIPPGSASNALVSVQDLYVTLGNLAGIQIAADQGRDSFNLLPILLDQSDETTRDHMIFEADMDEQVSRAPRHFAIREGDWKLILDGDENPQQLYHLPSDLDESDDLIAQPGEANRIDQMLSRFKTLRSASRTAPLLVAPTVTIASPANGSNFTQGDAVSFAGTAADAEDGDLTEGLKWASDIDGVIGNGGVVKYANLSIGTHEISASVTDSHRLNNAAQVTVRITARVNRAPTATTIPDATATAGRFFSQNLSASFNDPDGDPLSYTATGLPGSLSINSISGVVSGTPSPSEVSNTLYEATVVATDSSNESVDAFFSIQVIAAPPPPSQQPSGGGGSPFGLLIVLALIKGSIRSTSSMLIIRKQNVIMR